jgi:phosphoribosyl 1,2-cyclic phosphodiesterase
LKISLWGTRGSLASPGPETIRYGGNTSCVFLQGKESPPIILDAGSGIRPLGLQFSSEIKEFHILLTHLHMDHVVGLPFFGPLLQPGVEVHIWGPASTTMTLQARIRRYLSPPLFPIHAREILSSLHFHELPIEPVEIGEFRIKAEMIIHPNPTVGYRITNNRSILTYLPDHEPALGAIEYPRKSEWTSGFGLAEGADLLVHDSQYTPDEYQKFMGFGHSSMHQATQFAELCQVKKFVPFHHDPSHEDGVIDRMISETIRDLDPKVQILPGMEGAVFDLD